MREEPGRDPLSEWRWISEQLEFVRAKRMEARRQGYVRLEVILAIDEARLTEEESAARLAYEESGGQSSSSRSRCS